MQEEGEPVCQHLLSHRFGPKQTQADTHRYGRKVTAQHICSFFDKIWDHCHPIMSETPERVGLSHRPPQQQLGVVSVL